jgi:hypothetical protein
MKGQHPTFLLVLALVAGQLLASFGNDHQCGRPECTGAIFTYLQEGDCALEADVYSSLGGAALL